MANQQTHPQENGQMNGTVDAPPHAPDHKAGSEQATPSHLPPSQLTFSQSPSSDECAQVVFEVVPQVMQKVRTEMRRRRGPEISVLQLRALGYLRRNPGATLSSLAEHVGLTLPSMSSQVSGLVARNLINRSVSAEDRRFVTLTLTEQGRSLMEAARSGTQDSLAKNLAHLAPEERATVVEAMHLLARVFAPPETDSPQTEVSQPSTEPSNKA